MNRTELGLYLRQCRKNAGLSKRQMADKLGYKTYGSINCIEQGRGPIPIERIHEFARVLDIDLDELLNKLEIAEPELHYKYSKLKKELFSEFKSQVARLGEAALHHRPFQSPSQAIEGYNSDTIYYVNFYFP